MATVTGCVSGASAINARPAATPRFFAQARRPKTRPSSSTAPVYYGEPAAHFSLETKVLGFDPDGNGRWLVIARFFDASGKPTRIMANSALDWISRGGYVQWQTRLRYGQPSAILSTGHDGPIAMSIRANEPPLGMLTVRSDTRHWPGPRIVAKALGPYAVAVGWFPRETRLTRVVRIDGRGRRQIVAVIAGPSSTYRDTSVFPGRHYRYVVYRADYAPVTLPEVQTPRAPPNTALSNAAGKAMWLYFTTNPLDDVYYRHLDPRAIVAQAVRAGLRYVELRTAYGAYWEITREAKPTIDAIVDGLAAHGIGTIGWTVPRDTTFEDVAASVRTAYYRTPKGTWLTGVAIDVERGDDFMGSAPGGRSALWQYVRDLRAALGERYLLVATIEDPNLERLSQRQYPYEQIAHFSSVLQPMAYWRMMARKPTSPAEVKALLRGSYEKVLRLARRQIPISIGGQTTAEGPAGYPSAAEITASLTASKSAGAIGECFFDWDGTQPYQWNALAGYRW